MTFDTPTYCFLNFEANMKEMSVAVNISSLLHTGTETDVLLIQNNPDLNLFRVKPIAFITKQKPNNTIYVFQFMLL